MALKFINNRHSELRVDSLDPACINGDLEQRCKVQTHLQILYFLMTLKSKREEALPLGMRSFAQGLN